MSNLPGTVALPTSAPPRANVLGVGVHAINMEQALALMAAAVDARRKGYICVTGVHGIMEAQREPGLKRILNESFLTTPDGMPTVWVGRMQRFSQMDRVFGPELMLEFCRLSVAHGYRHFLYGGSPGVAEELRRALLSSFPELQIVGTYAPPFRALNAVEATDLQATFRELKPDVTWIGLSTPKQEKFMAEYLDRLDTTLLVGVGAAFDYHTGRIQDAPRWVKRAGLQWLHRMGQEPRRLWKRYLINNPKFIVSILSQFAGLVHYDQPS
jgi:N-acetylglucosaminyldiphosphoundecaprenol N-acetyl-beta-D-mannosaminyltransferase